MIPTLVGAHTKWKIRYHFVWGTKYRHDILTGPVAKFLKETVWGICERYEFDFDSLGTDGDHVHLLAGAPPSQSPETMMRTIKSITAQRIFARFPSARNLLWKGSLWSVGYYIATAGDGQPMELMRRYVLNQGAKEESKMVKQLKML